MIHRKTFLLLRKSRLQNKTNTLDTDCNFFCWYQTVMKSNYIWYVYFNLFKNYGYSNLKYTSNFKPGFNITPYDLNVYEMKRWTVQRSEWSCVTGTWQEWDRRCVCQLSCLIGLCQSSKNFPDFERRGSLKQFLPIIRQQIMVFD